jgi:dihydrofolate reductase
VPRIINSTYVSLDGVVENPHLWPALDGPGEDAGPVRTDLLLSCDAVLMGRRTYEGFASVWPTRSGDPFSDRINSMRKYVVSSTLRAPAWNNTAVLSGDVAGAVRALKQEPGQDIVQYGIGPVTRLLLEHGLLDEMRLWLHPLFVGSGGMADLLFPNSVPATLELVDNHQLKNGTVILSYRLR